MTDGFLAETLEDIARTERAQVKCGAYIDLSDCDDWGDALEKIADHGIEAHGLPEDEPWTDEMIEEAIKG